MKEHVVGGGEDSEGYVLAYPQPPLRGTNIAHNSIQQNRESDMDIDKK